MTAVEWLEEELKANLKKVILEGDSELMESLFEQAKAMEKEQIVTAQPLNQNKMEDKAQQILFFVLLIMCVVLFCGYMHISINLLS